MQEPNPLMGRLLDMNSSLHEPNLVIAICEFPTYLNGQIVVDVLVDQPLYMIIKLWNVLESFLEQNHYEEFKECQHRFKCVLKNKRGLSRPFVFGQNVAALFAIKQKVLMLQSQLGMR